MDKGTWRATVHGVARVMLDLATTLPPPGWLIFSFKNRKLVLILQWEEVQKCKEIEETIESERLEISSGKLEIPREYFMQNGLNKGQK